MVIKAVRTPEAMEALHGLGEEQSAFRSLAVGLYSSYADLKRSLFIHLIDGPAWELLLTDDGRPTNMHQLISIK